MNDIEVLDALNEYMPSFAGEPADWPDVLRRAPARPRRRSLLFALVAVALIIAPAAFAFGNKIVDLFEGTPATPAIQQVYVTFNGSLTQAIQDKFAVHPVDITKVHGVIAIQTGDGPVYLWSAPEQGGGACFFVQYASETDTPESGASGCDPATAPNPTNISPDDYWTGLHPSSLIVFGYTYDGATSVEVHLSESSTLELPVTEKYFLADIDPNAQITRIVSYGADGRQVGEVRTFSTGR